MLEMNNTRLNLSDSVKAIFEVDFSQEREVNTLVFEKYKSQVKQFYQENGTE